MKFKAIILGTMLGIGSLMTFSHDNVQGATKQSNVSQTSHAQVTIHNGGLTLDKIPDFSFSNTGSANEYHLHLSHPGASNRVQVTDYRNQDRIGSQRSEGWRLQVSAPQIKPGFALSLNDHNYRDSSLTHKTVLDAEHPTQNIMGSRSNGGYGVHSDYFDQDSDATLSVPNTPPQNYSVNLKWELYTPVNSDLNKA